jgi:hypothetical protein
MIIEVSLWNCEEEIKNISKGDEVYQFNNISPCFLFFHMLWYGFE